MNCSKGTGTKGKGQELWGRNKHCAKGIGTVVAEQALRKGQEWRWRG